MTTKQKILFIFLLLFLSSGLCLKSSISNIMEISKTNDKWCKYYFELYHLNKYKDPITEQKLTLKKFQNLGLSVGKWESNLNPNMIMKEPVVHGSAYGTYAILSPTAKIMGWKGKNPKELLDPEINAQCAIKFLALKITDYEGNIIYALSAYNAGKARLKDNGRLRNQWYVDNIYPLYVELNRFDIKQSHKN